METVIKPLLSFAEGLGRMVMLLTKSFLYISIGQIHWKNTLDQMLFIGVNSLPIALITAIFVGMVFSLQVTDTFIRFGGSSVIGGVVALAIVRELAPVLTGVVVAGRVGSAMAAELGSMKVTEQVDALTVMASDPVKYLVVPRLLASLVMLPVLTVLADVVGIAGGYLVAVLMKGIGSSLFLTSAQQLLEPSDVTNSMFKSVFFGLLIAIIGCTRGLTTAGGAKGVGMATTSSVVIALLSIFISNYFLSAWLFPR